MANKTIGSIPYSLALRVCNPSESDIEKKIFASAQSRETIGLRLLAAHMRQHGSTYSVGTLVGVLSDAVECIVELLKSGYSVDLEGLARFYVTLNSTGVGKVEDFSTSLIKQVNIRADIADTATAELNSDVEFEYAMTREEQAKAKKAAKAALPSAPEDEGDDDGNENGNENGGGNGGEITE